MKVTNSRRLKIVNGETRNFIRNKQKNVNEDIKSSTFLKGFRFRLEIALAILQFSICDMYIAVEKRVPESVPNYSTFSKPASPLKFLNFLFFNELHQN